MKEKSITKKILWYVFLLALMAVTFWVTIHVPTWWNEYQVNKIRKLIPQNPLWPADDMDYTQYDRDDSSHVAFTEEGLTITYSDGTVREVPFAEIDDLKILHEHVEEARYGWINLHNGALLATYTFTRTEGTDEVYYQFYQHINYTDYVYVWREVR